jgi:hypothetical protein
MRVINFMATFPANDHHFSRQWNQAGAPFSKKSKLADDEK